MNFKQALTLMKQGTPMKLPSWVDTGFGTMMLRQL